MNNAVVHLFFFPSQGNSGQQVAGTSEKRVKLMEPLKEKSQCTNIVSYLAMIHFLCYRLSIGF